MTAEVVQRWAGSDDEAIIDQGQDQFEVWPENWPVLLIFLSMSTQWRWTGGMEPRRCGLDDSVLQFHFEMASIGKKARPQAFRDLRAMESVALAAWQTDKTA